MIRIYVKVSKEERDLWASKLPKGIRQRVLKILFNLAMEYGETKGWDELVGQALRGKLKLVEEE